MKWKSVDLLWPFNGNDPLALIIQKDLELDDSTLNLYFISAFRSENMKESAAYEYRDQSAKDKGGLVVRLPLNADSGTNDTGSIQEMR